MKLKKISCSIILTTIIVISVFSQEKTKAKVDKINHYQYEITKHGNY